MTQIAIERGVLIVRSGWILRSEKRIPIPMIFSVTRSGLIMKKWIIDTASGRYIVPSNSGNETVISYITGIMARQNQVPLPQERFIPQAPIIQTNISSPPSITGSIEKEIVKIRCSYCRTINPDSNPKCNNCGAKL